MPEQAQRVDRDIAQTFRDLRTRMGCVVSITPRPLYPRERPRTHLQEAGWAQGPVWTCAKILALTRIRSPDRPARSQSLYRVSYPGPNRPRGTLFQERKKVLKWT
jgi:hypothetical protein